MSQEGKSKPETVAIKEIMKVHQANEFVCMLIHFDCMLYERLCKTK